MPHVEETTKVRGRLRHTRLFAGIAAAALALSACTPGASESADTGGTTTTTPEATSGISKEFPSDVPINLTLATFETGGPADALEAIIAAFEEKHPNVSIEAQYTSFNDYPQRIRLQMTGDDAPDIAQAGQAFVHMGFLVEGETLLPLDDYAELYGWADRFGAGLLDQSRFEPGGKKFGSGDLYGVSKGGNMVGIYFNRTVLDELGVSVPFNTMAEFQAALEAAKAAGYIPMALGNADQWPANHTLSVLISQYCDNSEMLGWIFGNDGADFTAPCFQEAASLMESWARDSLIDPAANGLSFEDGINRFAEGNSAFFVTGNWALATMQEKLGDNVGFTGFPGVTPGSPARATGATVSPFGISAKTEWPDVAAAFIDFMTGPETWEIRKNIGGYTPLISGLEVDTPTPLLEEFYEVWDAVIRDDGLTLFLDWSTVGMGNVMFPAIQEMLAGRISAETLTQQIQAEWETGRG